MLLSIPPKFSVSSVMGYLKGKSSLMIFDRFANLGKSSLMIFDRFANLKYRYGSSVRANRKSNEIANL